MGNIRAQFVLEALEDLRNSLNKIGSGLVVTKEMPEHFIPSLLSADKHNLVVFQQEVCSEELAVEANLVQSLRETGHSVAVKSLWGSTLHHIHDLPYNPNEFLPHVYGELKRENAGTKVRELVATPKKGDLVFPENDALKNSRNYMPTLKDLGFETPVHDNRSVLKFIGGESAGLKRIDEYIYQRESLGHYAETRNNLIGSEYSSKFSPWLANGAVSCRDIYWKVKAFEEKHGPSESTKKFIDELFWRDFSYYWCMLNGTRVFFEYGITDRTHYNWRVDKNLIQRWREGKTGMPLIDALMRELNESGFMSNRGR